jgi:TonB-dependent SusC/RagA subfamily outer membrane receptor
MTNPQKASLKKADRRKIIRIMRLAVLFLLTGIGAGYAEATYSQSTQLSLIINNKSIKDVFTEIENNSEYVFFYYDNALDVNRRVSINVKNQTVDKILDKLFEATDNTYAIEDRQIFISRKAPAAVTLPADRMESLQQQTRTIAGTVKDESGEPLIGVNVSVKGTTIGSITDLDGRFSIAQAPQGSTLVVSYVGYVTQEIPTGNTANFAIILREDSQALSEVVVVGYGTQRKETLSGAVTAIRADEITTTKTENLVTNLQGKMPGLLIRQQTGEPGVFDNMVSIRGYGEPLIVIDGITRNRDGVAELAQLNSEDVESISILKDASAAIYGMNAANGVIIVTTKKGEASNARFSYSGLYGMKVPTGMELTVDAYTYRVMANEKHYSAIAPENRNPAALVDPDADGYRRLDNLNAQSQIELTYKAPFLKGLIFGSITFCVGKTESLTFVG